MSRVEVGVLPDAARQLNYYPNYAARSLRGQRTYMVGVMPEEIAGDFG